MAADLNTISISGRLTRDPELKGDGNVLKMRVASSANAKIDGEWGEKTNYIDVVLFGRLASVLEPYLSKGKEVAVTGRLDYDEYQAKDGTNRHSYQIISENFKMFGSKSDMEVEKKADAGADIPF